MREETEHKRYLKLDPGIKASFALGLLLLVILTDKPLYSLSVLVIVLALAVRDLGYSLKALWRFRRWPFVFLLLSVITVVVQVGRQPAGGDFLWQQGVFAISRASLLEGAALFLKAWTAFTCLIFFGKATQLSDFFVLLERLHVPNIVITMMYLIHRLMFQLKRRFDNVIESQQLRHGYGQLRRGIPALGLAMGATFSWTFVASKRMADAMDLRLFNEDLRFMPPVFSKDPGLRRKLLGLLLFFALFALLLVLIPLKPQSDLWRWLV